MVPHHNITVNREDPKPQIGEIIKHIKPNWPTDQLKFKPFEEGLTNALYGVYVDNPNDMILVRIFGQNSELYVDREQERKTIKLLASHGLAASLYATFDNGNAYQFIPGRLLLNSDVRVQEIADLIAQEIGRLHSIPVPSDYAPGQTRGNFFIEFDKMLTRLPKALDDPKDNERYQKHVMTFDFHKEIRDMEDMALKFNEEMVIVHHDLLEANIILSNDEKHVHFIDFECAGLDYGSIDIAVHFIVYLNILEFDPVRFPYPTEQEQRRFITKYLEARYPGKEVTEEDLQIWYKRVNKMAALAFLYWGLWCVLNGITSNIDFDFMGLGITELEEYRKMKSRIMAL